MGRPFCENFLILVKCPRDSRKKSDWFRCSFDMSNPKKFAGDLVAKRVSGNQAQVIIITTCADLYKKGYLLRPQKKNWWVTFVASFQRGYLHQDVCDPMQRSLDGHETMSVGAYMPSQA